ncbi:MAG: hypothetical protein K2P75_04245 [Sphingobacteriaceae bacterium]|nr:hypothetical protein [Sphingobacteriaceae bacterium]
MKNALLLSFLFLCIINVYSQEVVLDTLQKRKQQANLAYTSLYKENSAMSYTSPGGEIGAPSKYVINGKLTTNYMVFAPVSLPIAFAVNPDFTVRVRKERSAGVRTPSFTLGGTFYVRLTEELKQYKYAQISFTHHSNGQDESALLSDGTINTKTGNFNTNDLTLAYNFGNFTNSLNGRANSIHHKVGLEWHKWFNYEPVLIGDYGFTRLNYDFSFRIYQNYSNKKGGWKKSIADDHTQTLEKEKWRFNAQLSYAVNQYTNHDLFAPKRRLNVEASANYSLPFMQNVFIMASVGYYGEDPYNIYFKDRYAFMRFGLSTTFTRYKVR